MIYEFAFLIHSDGRYAAHVEMDRLLSRFNRFDADGHTRWRYALIRVGVAHIGLLRTENNELIHALQESRAPWSAITLPSRGEPINLLVQLTPKKPAHLTRFRTDDAFTCWHGSSRFLQAIDVEEATIEGRSTESVNKPGFAHSFPTALLRIEGIVEDERALKHIYLYGVGGSRAFGLGLPMSEGSRGASYMLNVMAET